LLNDMCGFCCFSMRFVVFIDLFGTLILPATVIYLGYLIYEVASGNGQFPLIAIVMLASIYGLQAIIFILKRRWQHIGWMIVYLLAYPIYGFALPIYSFWHMDDFAWGSTRIVVGEKGGKQYVATSDEKFDDRMIPMKRWDEHARETGVPLGPAIEILDTNSVFAEEYPVPASISRWQQGMRGSYLPAPSQVSGARTHTFVGSHYAPSMVSVPAIPPRQWAGARSEVVEMDEFANGGRMSMVNPQMPLSTHIPRGSLSMSQAPSRYGGSQIGLGAQFAGTAFDGFDSSYQITDPALARQVIRNVLKEVDINTTTTKQVRALVESKLGLGINAAASPEQRKLLDDMIDKELEEMI